MSLAGTDVLPNRSTTPPTAVTPARRALNLICTSRTSLPLSVLVSTEPEKWSVPLSTTASRMPDPTSRLFGLNVTAFFGSLTERTAGSKET